MNADAALHIQRLMGTVASVDVVPRGGLSAGSSHQSSPTTFVVFFGDSHTYTFDQTSFDPQFTQDSVQPGDRVTLWYEKPAIGDMVIVAIEDESLPAAKRVKYTLGAYRDPQGTHNTLLLVASVLAIVALLFIVVGTFLPKRSRQQPQPAALRQVNRSSSPQRRRLR